MISFVFAIAQTIAPALPDNQWDYAWPLGPEWNVTYYNGDESINGQPPVFAFQWHCHLHELTKNAVCVSTWEVKAGATCREDRDYVPFEHPYVWYERYRGKDRVYLWSYRQVPSQWPEWNVFPAYVWTYERIQRIPGQPGCLAINGCAPRATYYITNRDDVFVFDMVVEAMATWPSNPVNDRKVVPWPISSSPISPVTGSHVCRGWLHNNDWCSFNANRPECGALTKPTNVKE